MLSWGIHVDPAVDSVWWLSSPPRMWAQPNGPHAPVLQVRSARPKPETYSAVSPITEPRGNEVARFIARAFVAIRSIQADPRSPNSPLMAATHPRGSKVRTEPRSPSDAVAEWGAVPATKAYGTDYSATSAPTPVAGAVSLPGNYPESRRKGRTDRQREKRPGQATAVK